MSASERLPLHGPSLSHHERANSAPPFSSPSLHPLTSRAPTLTARRQLGARRVSRPPHALHAHDGVGVLRPQVLPRPSRGRLPPGGLGLEHSPRGGHGAHGPGRFRWASGLLVQLAEERPEKSPKQPRRERVVLCGKGWEVHRPGGGIL